jgi:hypothetical protein
LPRASQAVFGIRRCPRALPPREVRQDPRQAARLKLGPHRLGPMLGHPRSNVYRVLSRAGLSRLPHLDRPTATPIRYERERPGELVHLDVKGLGRIRLRGGWRLLGSSKRVKELKARRRLRLPGISIQCLMTDQAKNYLMSKDIRQSLLPSASATSSPSPTAADQREGGAVQPDPFSMNGPTRGSTDRTEQDLSAFSRWVETHNLRIPPSLSLRGRHLQARSR